MSVDQRIQRIDKIMDELRQLREEILASTSAPSKRVSEKDLDSLDWKTFTPGQDGEWAFIYEKGGTEVRENLKPLKGFIVELKMKGEIVVGDHRYRISQDKFLNRFKVESKHS